LKGRSAVEKNWVLFDDARTDSVKCIYGWYPLIIGDIVGDEYVAPSRHESVLSGCGVDERRAGERRDVVCDACGFLYIAPHYYHCFVVLDPTTYAVKRHTRFLSLTATD
jgi:hypothetical protein